MENKFNANNISSYVNFEFNHPTFESALLHDSMVEYTADMNLSNLCDLLVGYAKIMMEAEFGGRFTAQRGPDDTMDIEIFEDGRKRGNAHVDIFVIDEMADELLPNGDKVSDVEYYTWADFDRLRDSMMDGYREGYKAACRKETKESFHKMLDEFLDNDGIDGAYKDAVLRMLAMVLAFPSKVSA